MGKVQLEACLAGVGAGDGSGALVSLFESPHVPARNIPNGLPVEPLAGCQAGAGARANTSIGFLGDASVSENKIKSLCAENA